MSKTLSVAKHIWLFLCVQFLCVAPDLRAQVQIPFINYTMKNGLVQSQVRSICQDGTGYIWIGTMEGLSRFDGKNFKNYTVSEGLPSNQITEVLADRKSRLWIATSGMGLVMFDGKTFKTYTTKDGLVSNTFEKRDHNGLLMEDANGNIWCRSDRGISVINSEGILSYDADNGFTNNRTGCFVEDGEGRIICGGDETVFVIEQGKVSQHTLSGAGMVTRLFADRNGDMFGTGRSQIFKLSHNTTAQAVFSANNILTATADASGHIWLSTLNGVYLLDGQNFQVLDRLNDPTVFKIFEDSQHNIWLLSTDNGIYKYSDGYFDNYGSASGLAGDETTCIFEDSEGNIWTGTNNGVSMYGKVIFETYTTTSGLPNNHVLTLAVDSSGNVWCAPMNNGLVKINRRKMTLLDSPEKTTRPGTNNVISMSMAGDKLLLGYISEGMGTMTGDRWQIEHSAALAGIDINNILDVNGEYWLATSGGLGRKKGKITTFYSTESGLPDDNVFFLAADTKNRIWCTTVAGVSVFDGQLFTTYTEADGLPGNSCTDIAVDGNGAIWVGTENGLCRITEEDGKMMFKNYLSADGLASNAISVVHVDRQNRLWVGNNGGLNVIDLTTNEISHYAEEDGFTPMDCYLGAAATDLYGNVWFGTVAGLVKYLPSRDVKRQTPPRTRITNIVLTTDGDDIRQYADTLQTTELPAGLSLPHNRNTIRLDWIGIHFTVPTKNHYRYILEGYEKNWREGKETSREYQLSPGRYTFKVMSCNNDGVWNAEPVAYTFTVRPPWWATWFAYTGYAVVLFLIFLLYAKWRERALREKNRLLEQKVQERTVEIERQKESIREQRDRIAEQRKEIMDSIRYAKQIQTALMPDKVKMTQVLPEHFLFFRPRDVVSGDYYWVERKGSKAMVIAADCTGHGVPGAFMSMLGISILNEIVIRQEADTAAAILNELRRSLKTMLSQKGMEGEQRDGMDTALCIIDEEAMEVQYAGAYISMLLVRNKELTEYKADKMPVGIHVAGEKNFTNYSIPLQPNDMIYIFSDGYVDQFGGPNNTKFKTKPFKQMLVNISDLPVARQQETIAREHDEWKGTGEQIDDIMVVGIRINGRK
ncbi:MAG: SpoIIE family protein phosphatase [Bacteroidales bacterium]|nr:SpoIIE family protein phosphatase [Bacteroidales bacterium]